MKIKTSELTGRALDWAVVRANFEVNFETVWNQCRVDCHYSWDWRQGGPIIEREEIYLNPNNGNDLWYAEHTIQGSKGEFGPTPLIAAMRCYVASKLGDEVEIPEELK